MNLTLITPPLVDPVSIQAAFCELRITERGPDGRILRPQTHPDYEAVVLKLRAATQDCENVTGRAFVQQTLRLSGSLQMWRQLYCSVAYRPGSAYSMTSLPWIELLRPPFIAITSIRYYDATNALQTIDPANYYSTSYFITETVQFVSGFAMPALYDRPDALRIDYQAGYQPGTPGEDYDTDDPPQYLADNVPAPIKQAVLLTLRLMYDDTRPDDKAATQQARDALLWPYKVLRV